MNAIEFTHRLKKKIRGTILIQIINDKLSEKHVISTY